MKAWVALALVLAAASAVPAVAQTSRGAPACGELPKTWEGTAYAASGDSLSGVDLKNTIKLWGIRAAEMPSVPGMRARAALEDMLGSGENKVSCRMTGWDFACRAVAQCTISAAWPTGSVAQPHDLALRLAEDGWVYGAGLNEPPSWDKDANAKVAHFESIARQARKGLWPHWLGEEPKP
jgi:endonuclease YncB( thermonuclease family)